MAYTCVQLYNKLMNHESNTKIIFDDYNNRPYYHIIEKFITKEQICGRQALFVVKNKNDINIDLLNIEINNFYYVSF